MCKELNQENIEKLQDLAVDLNLIESLSRILLNEIMFDSDLEKFDVENLSNVLKQRIVEMAKKFRAIMHELEFGI